MDYTNIVSLETKEYIVKKKTDLTAAASIVPIGSKVLCVEDSNTYILFNKNEWVLEPTAVIDIDAKIADAIQNINSFETAVVEALPQEGQSNTFYFVTSGNNEENQSYDEYLYLNGNWEKIGSSGGTTITPEQPDWEETDTTSLSYIKNKPFYETSELTENTIEINNSNFEVSKNSDTGTINGGKITIAENILVEDALSGTLTFLDANNEILGEYKLEDQTFDPIPLSSGGLCYTTSNPIDVTLQFLDDTKKNCRFYLYIYNIIIKEENDNFILYNDSTYNDIIKYIKFAYSSVQIHKIDNKYIDWSGDQQLTRTIEANALILRSTTSGSTKKFKITVDDTGALSTKEVV